MEKVTKTPTLVESKGTLDQYGNQAYLVTFTDGTSGFFRTPNQDLFFINQPATFMYGQVPKKDGSGTYSKIQRYKPDFEQGATSGRFNKVEDLDDFKRDKHRGQALDKATYFIVAQINQGGTTLGPADVLEIAESFNDWLNLEPVTVAGITAGILPQTELNDDVLPF